LRSPAYKLSQLFHTVISLFQSSNERVDSSDFQIVNNHILLQRLTMVSIFLVLLYPYYFYIDFIALKHVADRTFWYTLTAIHLSGAFLSVVYLLMRFIAKRKQTVWSSSWSMLIINLYVMFYIFSGALGSINSQRLTGNIDAYVIILICAAVIFPILPKHFFLILLFNHSIFLAGLSVMSRDVYTLLSKQVNTTFTVMVAFLLAAAFFSYRKNDFLNKLKLKESEESFRQLFDVNPYPLFLTTLNEGKVVLMNKRARELYQTSLEKAGNFDAGMMYTSPEERRAVIEKLVQAKSIKNYIIEKQTGPHVTAWMSINYELIDYAGEKHILAGVADITEFKQTEEELRKHASIDMLTGVINRRSGIDMLQNALDMAQTQYMEFVLCFIDVNKLKEVNDTFGHPEGDYLIKTVCEIIKKHVGKDDVFFRFGGDEFIILFFGKQLEDVRRTWKDMNRTFDKVNRSSHKPYSMSVSYGMYHYQSGMAVSLDEIIEQADMDMYKQKSKRKVEGEQALSKK
jgi:diguanylate cyclase (GGDEF)-like protein/PAS domain S-box-containing protein